MKIQDKINQRLNERKWYHRATALTLVFCLICAFVVPLDIWTDTGVVRPAMALTTSPLSGTQEYFDPIPDTNTWKVENWGINLAYGYLQDIGVTYNNQPLTVPYQIEGGTDGSVNFKLKLNYKFDDPTNVISDPYVSYQLPSNVSIEQNSYGDKAVVNDPNYSGTAGYYFITTTGLVVIHFTNDYIKYVKDHNNAMIGSVDFNCTVYRKDERNGTQTVTIGGSEINIPFDTKNLSQRIIYPLPTQKSLH